MAFTEQGIEQQLRCPLSDSTDGFTPFECAAQVFQWAVVEAFRGRLIPLPVLRGKFEKIWSEQVSKEEVGLFYGGLRQGNSAARRLFLFLQHYEILKPVETYEVQVNGYKVAGKYALVLRHHDKRTEEVPSIVQVESFRPTYFASPNAIAMLRYQHLMESTDYTDARVYHLTLLRGEPWKQTFESVALVRQTLASILNTVAAARHPVPGSHCASCTGKPCRSVSYGGSLPGPDERTVRSQIRHLLPR